MTGAEPLLIIVDTVHFHPFIFPPTSTTLRVNEVVAAQLIDIV